ncbi:MAG: hypothetical protein AVDCRST_MAG11-1682 [uncultured Gemmatimonadaceae bacterium]|uniref:Uncharacterized protein n=1 Tax=uncultured Gemmatimonadaceae bacterium TaxID=246130 RepID=A0A6J4KSK7_9BACT|nr:MAG: hypothetical protein AVDCRST_MAG11-1682 [uncultured Gemmatimonadaceae bacterium]
MECVVSVVSVGRRRRPEPVRGAGAERSDWLQGRLRERDLLFAPRTPPAEPSPAAGGD